MTSFIVHAKGFVRETTAELLREQGVSVVEAADAAAAVVHMEQLPAAVLVCSEVPPVESWAECRRVVLLDGVDDDDILALLQCGAHVARPTLRTVAALLEAAFSVDPPAEDAPVVRLPSERRSERPMLTRRQLEVVRLIARGHTSQEIADALGVRPKTVENYKQRVFLRLGVQNQAHAVARCARLGLMDDAHLSSLASAS
jgi:DNA-binding NarL/FixJ family response regulator